MADQPQLGSQAHEREANYIRERDCYQRLLEEEVTDISGFSVPQLVGFDDELMIVEMDAVSPPFLLDFGKAYVDIAPEFSPEVLADWEAEREELFGDRWPEVRSLIGWLKTYGIHYFDAKPGNICFADD